MSEWAKTTLGEVVGNVGGSFKTGPFGTSLKASEYSTNGVPVISVGEISYGALSLRNDTPRVSPAVTSRLSEYLLEAGDIVFGRKGAVDRSAWVKPEESGWFLGSDGIRARLPLNVDSRFIAYQLRSEPIREWLLRHASGSTLLSLNQSTLSRVPIVLPSISEQEAITEVLGALDDKIAANTKLAETARAKARAHFDLIMKSATQDSTLGDVLTLEYGKPLLAGSRRDGEVDVFGSGGIVGSHDVPHSSGPGIVVGRKGTAGAVHWAARDFFPIDTTFFVEPKKAELHSMVFCFHLLQSLGLTNQNSDSAVPGLNRNDAYAMRIQLPADSQVLDYREVAMPLMLLASQLDTESAALATTRDTLLPQLMSGKLRVKDAGL